MMGPQSSNGYQPAMSATTLNTTHLKVMRKQTSDVHTHYQQQPHDQRELYHNNASSHSPSRDMSLNPPTQPVGHSPYPGQTNIPPKSGQQMPPPGGFYQQERYQPSQSPIPNQGPVPAPQTYPYMFYHHQNSMGYPPNGGNPPYPHVVYPPNNSNSYQYIAARLPPELPQDGDHQNSITQKR